MGDILVRNAIDRRKYPKTMMYVDGEGNIRKANKRLPLSEEEKADRKAARDKDRKAFQQESAELRAAMYDAKNKAKKSLSPEDAEEYANAKAEYDNFRKG